MEGSSIDFELCHEVPSDRAVLLFHGLTGSPFEMKKYGLFLHKQGYDVFCYSFPGHGEKLFEIHSVKWTDWCNFAQEKYEHLRGSYKYFFVSGLCLGASMSVYLAEKYTDITGIIALSTTLFLDGFSIPKFTIPLFPIALHTVARYYYTFPEDDSFGVKNEKTRKTLKKVMSKTEVSMDNYPLNCVYGLMKLSQYVRKNLKKVKCPLLCIHSKYDNLATTKGAKIVLKKISSEIKEYVELDNSYHMILYDNEKEFVMNTVNDFMDKITGRTREMQTV